LPSGLLQTDASGYRGASSLQGGAVLVVGNAQSGGQIAEDLAEAGRTVFLATGRVGRVPRRYRGQDISFWFVESGLFDVPRKEFLQPSGRVAARPLLGAVHTISLQSLSAQGVILLGRFTGFESGGHLSFADDVKEHIQFADEVSTTIKRQIDEYIARAGIGAPAAEPDPAEIVAARLPNPPIRSLDPVATGITTVIWCVGFQGDFSWVRIPGVLDDRGQPVHEEGVAAAPGIYFAGLDFASTRKSGTILAIAEEAPRLVEHLARRP
jgi:putative flavoprotein involved in K+ transport